MNELYHVTQLPLFTLTRFCPDCKIEKSFEHFSKDKQRRDGLCCYCKPCSYKRVYASQKANPHLLKKKYASRREHKEYDRKYNQTHLSQHAESQRRREARKQSVTIGKVSYKHILERDGMYCYICDQPILAHHALHFDHVIPLVRSGPHTEDNIKPTHEICNQRKGAKLLSEMTSRQRRGVQ